MRNQTRGFTLIELMVVVAIIGVFAAMATPSISSTTERHRLLGELQQLTSFHSQARNVSRTVRKCVLVTNPDGLNWTATNMGDDCQTPSGAALPPLVLSRLIHAPTASHYFLFNGSFSADGVETAKTPAEFSVGNQSGNFVRDIRIYGAVGRVTVVRSN